MAHHTRRRFLKETVAFSASILLERSSLAQYVAGTGNAAFEGAPDSYHLFALGDWGTDTHSHQAAVSHAMQAYAATNRIHPKCLLFLGDNWYGWLFGGSASKRWRTQFEEMYPADVFPGKCFAILGNHDYEHRPGDKVAAQLEYAKKPGTRWTLPSKWYSFAVPEARPLIRFIALDSNYPERDFFRTTPALTRDEIAAQNAWFQQQLAAPTQAPFTIVIAHHPIFSNGDHGDTPALIRDWRHALNEHRVPLYLCGHDHDLQHLEFAGDPTSYVVSGGGGAVLRNMHSRHRNEDVYGRKVAGFTHIEANNDNLIVRLVDSSGTIVHSFSKQQTRTIADPGRVSGHDSAVLSAIGLEAVP